MIGLEFAGDIPFTDVYIHSIIQAPDGRRMSKSLGTGIDPLDLIEGGPRPPVFASGGEFPAYGADAVRFGLLAMSSSQDVRFNEEKIAQGRQLANKLWNASRLVLLRAPDDAARAARGRRSRTRWILSRLQRAKAATARAIEAFEFHRAALGLYDFVYGELCDWYLELVKPRLYADDNAEVSAVALHVLSETLALAHPVIPFVTEEIWGFVPGAEGLLMAQPFPAADDSLLDEAAEAELARAIEAVQALRGWRDRVGARARARRSRPGSTPRATTAPLDARRAAGPRRVERQRHRSRWRRSRCRAGASRSSPPRPSTPRPRRSATAAPRERLEAEIAPRRGQARQRAASSPRRRRRSSRPSARSSRACAQSSRRSIELVAGAGRGPPALARAVRHAVRARAHAPAADRARQPAAGVPRRSTSSARTASPRRCG